MCIIVQKNNLSHCQSGVCDKFGRVRDWTSTCLKLYWLAKQVVDMIFVDGCKGKYGFKMIEYSNYRLPGVTRDLKMFTMYRLVNNPREKTFDCVCFIACSGNIMAYMIVLATQETL